MMKFSANIILACVAVSLFAAQSAEAGNPIGGQAVPARLLHSTQARPLYPTPDPVSASSGMPMRSASSGMPMQNVSLPRVVNYGAAPQGAVAYGHQNYQSYGGGMYPQTGAPLYPSPTPNVPTNIGGTYITSHALSPHEMLYPHQYKSMYGPFYWKVRGKWVVTPWGVRSHDHWELQGTEVTVKYRDHYPLFSRFHPRR